MTHDEIISSLIDLGYSLKDHGRYWMTNAAYREGDSPHSIVIYKNTLKWFDYPNSKSGHIKDLLELSGKKIENFFVDGILNNNIEEIEEDAEKFDEEILNQLVPNYSFFLKRGISEETLRCFECGFCHNGKLRMRIVFPIRDFQLRLIGFAGRTVLNLSDSTIKWKIIGRKKNFVYPWHMSSIHIKEEKSVVVVEGISDLLALWDAGVKNVLCTFGLFFSENVINYLTSLNIDNVIISYNNEESKRGITAAEKAQRKLSSFFENVRIILPYKKDFGEMTKEEILDWRKKI